MWMKHGLISYIAHTLWMPTLLQELNQYYIKSPSDPMLKDILMEGLRHWQANT